MNPIEKIIERLLRDSNSLVLIPYLIISILLFAIFNQIVLLGKFNLNILDNYNNIFKYTFGDIFYNIILFAILIVLLAVILLARKLLLNYISSKRTKKLIDKIPPLSKWIFQGSLKIAEDSLAITSSDLGCLMKEVYIKNFIMSFNVKIINGGRVGIIFRAQDLENYLMLQIELANKEDKGTIIYDIIPLVRTWGDLEHFRPYFRVGEEFILKYRKGLKIEGTIEKSDLIYDTNGIIIRLKVKDSAAVLIIESRGKRDEFCWDIPTHTEPNIFQQKRRGPEGEEISDELENIFPEHKSASEIWFRNKCGGIGFRASDLEKAIITNLRIQKI